MNVFQGIQQRVIHLDGIVAGNGDNTVLAAPGPGLEFVISYLQVQNTTVNPTTFKVRGGGNINATLAQNQGDGVAIQKPSGREWRLGNNQPIVINLSGANSHLYSIDYWVDAAS